MIEIEYFKPFYTTVNENKLTLFFAYKYFTIKKDGDIFDFVPHEETKIIVNLKSKSIENISDMFVFKRGEHVIKLPLYQLMLVSNMRKFLLPIIEETIEIIEANKGKQVEKQAERIPRKVRKEARGLIQKLEEENIERLIEKSLQNNDKALFEQLMKLKKKHGGQSNGGA